MVDHDGQIFVFQVFVQKVAQLRLRPNQMDPHRQSAAGENRPANLRLWSFVGTYGVKRNVDEHIRYQEDDCETGKPTRSRSAQPTWLLP